MSNDLKKLAKELRGFAKRCKNIKYTESMLFTFLMIGFFGLFSSENTMAAGQNTEKINSEDDILEMLYSEETVQGSIFDLGIEKSAIVDDTMTVAQSTDRSIENQRKTINSSISDIKTTFRQAKRENEKLLRGANLELVRLMEQGDQVVKSPWSSWQYGINYFYNDWKGSYKGTGNKIPDQRYTRDNTLNRYMYSSNNITSYGNTTDLNMLYEPNASIPVAASLTPLIPQEKQANLALNIDLGNLPSFEARIAKSPSAPVIAGLSGINSPSFSLVAESLANGGERYYDSSTGDGGVIESVAVLKGNFVTERRGNATQQYSGYIGDNYRNFGTWNYAYAGYDVMNPFNHTATSNAPGAVPLPNDGTILTNLSRGFTYSTAAKAGFVRMVSEGTGSNNTSTMLNNGNMMYLRRNLDNGPTSNDALYGGKVKEIVHLDVHQTFDIATEKVNLDKALANLDTSTSTKINTAWNDFAAIAAAKNLTKSQTYINSGTAVVEGEKVAYVNTYDHLGRRDAPENMATIINTGDITIHPWYDGTTELNKDAAVFIVSSEIYGGNGAEQLIYNSGNINVYNKNSTVYFLNPYGNERTGNSGGRRGVTLVNRAGDIKLYGDTSVGVYAKTPEYIRQLDLDFSDSQNSNGNFSPMTIYGDNSIGLYVEQVTNNTATGTQSSIVNASAAGNSVINGNFALNIGDANSTGNQNYTSTNTITMNNVSASSTIDSSATQGTAHTFELNDGNPVILKSYGIFSNYNIDFSVTRPGIAKTGHEINIFANTQENIGVLTGNGSNFNLGTGSINLIGGTDNIGIVVGGSQTSNTFGTVIGDNITITGNGSDRGNRAIYSWGAGNTVTANTVSSTNATNSIALVADNSSSITLNNTGGLTISGAQYVYDANRPNDNAGAVYANNSATIIIDRNSVPTAENIAITGSQDNTGTALGFGIFANNNATISAKNNWVKVTDGSTNIASLNNATIDLSGGTAEYSGDGYALYTDSTSNKAGAIDLTNATLKLGGRAVGYVRDQANPNVITFNNTNIEVSSNDVIITGLENSAGGITLNVGNQSAPNTLREQLLGSGVGNITGSTPSITKYKYAVVDGATINITSAVDKADSTADSDSEVFTRRLQYQNSLVNIASGGSVSANLSSTDLADIDSTVPVGIAVSASPNSVSGTNMTGILNSGTVESDRTDGTTGGGIGLYADFAQVNGIVNDTTGVINIEKGTVNAANSNGVGIYGTNSTPITNRGAINVDGEKGIGILGLSARINPNTGAVVDPTADYTGASNLGQVNITNNGGTIVMDGDGALGIYGENNTTSAMTGITADVNVLNATGSTITVNGNNNSIAMAVNGGTANKGNSTATNDGTINVNGTTSAGIYGNNSSVLTNSSSGIINIAASPVGSESIGMFTDDINTVMNTAGTFNVGNSSYGMFGKNINMTGGTFNVDDNGVGIYSTGPTVNLSSGTMTVKNNNAVGVYIADDNISPVNKIVSGNINMTVGDDNSFGYLISARNAKTDLTTGVGTTGTVGSKSVYIYSAAPYSLGGIIENNTAITATGSNGYGIYSVQNGVNNADMELNSSGYGNIGMYSTSGRLENKATINVGKSNPSNEEFGIGMATGYYDKNTGISSNQGTVVNTGVINVTERNSVGMYAVGAGSTAINETSGVINLDASNAVGMYIDQGATGINYGTIQTVPNSTGTGMKGVVAVNGGIFKNYGTINIQGTKAMGVYRDTTGDVSSSAEDTDTSRGVTGTNTSAIPVYTGTATDSKDMGSVSIKTPSPSNGRTETTVTIGGKEVGITGVDTDIVSPQAPNVIINDSFGATSLNLAASGLNNISSNSEIASIGMYVDTSGINYTNPIKGLQYLPNLDEINLIIGNEIARYTNAKAIQVGDNILQPYNDELANVASTGVELNVNSGSLTWLAQPISSSSLTKPIETVYLVKVPYTDFANKDKDMDTYHFLDGLEQRYGVEGVNTREKELFNKLNSIGKGEAHIFTQAVNEMKGYQYSNTQARINSTGNAIDKEINYLMKDWSNPSKQANKMKVFGMRDEYKTDTAGVIDYTSNAYGIAYVHEDETIKLGNSSGWYAGVVNNNFRFKDIGKSRENQTMLKLGIFKSSSPDHNGALKWTIAGEGFVGQNHMHRRYLVVDDIFNAKSNYNTYGVALKNEIGYDLRASERFTIRPYGALDIEYGRFSDIKEKSGEMRLEIKGDDYHSIKPEAGIEFKYKQPLALRTTFTASLGAAYEKELGRIENNKNKARVRYTTADWYNLRNDRKDRNGNGKFDLKLGLDNQRFGVTVNAGYDTKGENIRAGLGFRVIY